MKPHLKLGISSGPWAAGCFLDPDSSCQCKYIFTEAYAGSIATINVDNGLSIGDGGNDSPPLDEARRNAKAIATLPDLIDAAQDVIFQYEGDVNIRQSIERLKEVLVEAGG